MPFQVVPESLHLHFVFELQGNKPVVIPADLLLLLANIYVFQLAYVDKVLVKVVEYLLFEISIFFCSSLPFTDRDEVVHRGF